MRLRVIIFLLCLSLLHAWATPAALAEVDEEKLAKVKAAFLLNFIKFTTWPEDSFADPKSPLRVVVLGADDLGAVLDATLRDRTYMNRPIVLRRVARLPESQNERAAVLSELKASHLVYFTSVNELDAHEIGSLTTSGVLLVGAQPAQVRRGALLAFGMDDGKVIFHYNAEAGKASPLKLSSKLLTLARPVK